MLGYISHDECLAHDTGGIHPEAAERLEAISNQLIMSGLDYVLMRYDAPKATREQLERVHDRDYIERVSDTSPEAGSVEIDGDTVMSPGTLDAALRAAGAGILAVDLVMSGDSNPVFCGVRPPGHHAERGKAMGFCLFNNIAVAAAHAIEYHGLSRVAVIDFDVHHGNGTENIFKDDPRVLFCSSFQHPFYPFSGHEADTRNLVDVPLPAGTSGPAYREAVSEHWFPAIDRFRPELILISAGFDAHVLDDMSAFTLTEADYSWLTGKLVDLAKHYANGRIVSILEGGYEPGALARSVVAHLKALMD